MKVGQAQFGGRLLRAGDRLRRNLNPGQAHFRRGAVQAKAPHSAEQVPHMIDRQLAYPIAGGRIQLAGNGRIRLKEALRADPQRYAVKVFRQRRLLAEENLLFAFHNGHMHRLNIGGNHLQLR